MSRPSSFLRTAITFGLLHLSSPGRCTPLPVSIPGDALACTLDYLANHCILLRPGPASDTVQVFCKHATGRAEQTAAPPQPAAGDLSLPCSPRVAGPKLIKMSEKLTTNYLEVFNCMTEACSSRREMAAGREIRPVEAAMVVRHASPAHPVAGRRTLPTPESGPRALQNGAQQRTAIQVSQQKQLLSHYDAFGIVFL